MSWYRPLVSLVVVLTAWLISMPVTSAETPKVVTESYFVPAKDPGIQLYVRNKRPEGVVQFGPDKILLLVHGATYPGSPRSISRSVASRGWTTSPSAASTCTSWTCGAMAPPRARRR